MLEKCWKSGAKVTYVDGLDEPYRVAFGSENLVSHDDFLVLRRISNTIELQPVAAPGHGAFRVTRPDASMKDIPYNKILTNTTKNKIRN